MEINVHNPARLPDESQAEYKSRRNLSARLASRTTRVAFTKASETKGAKRVLVKAVGIRQAKKALRKARNEQRN